jgi:hypothetical protein
MTSFVTNLDQIHTGADDSAITRQYYIDKGFIVKEIGLRFENSNTLISHLKEKFEHGRLYDFRDFRRRFVFETDDFAIVVDNHLSKSFSLYARNYAALARVLEILGDSIKKIDPKSVSIVYYHMCKGAVEQNWINMDLADIPKVIPDLYPGIRADELAHAFKLAQEPILLLYGIPGVGKTMFLKFLLSTEQYKNIAYVKDADVMHSGEFWAEVAGSKHDMIIFDDLDFALSPRKEGDKGFVTNLLSYSDGIFSTSTKIVITTNQPIEKVDGALVRPGRCFDFLTLEPLTFSEGQVLWTTVLGMDLGLYEPMYRGQEYVTQAAIISDCKRIREQSEDRAYLKRGKRRYSIEQKMEEAGVAVCHPERRGGFKK